MGDRVPRRIIKRQVMALTLHEQYEEAELWLTVHGANKPPPRHTKGTWRDIRDSIRTLLPEVASYLNDDPSETEPRYNGYKERLGGFCINMRGGHPDGRRPDAV